MCRCHAVKTTPELMAQMAEPTEQVRTEVMQSPAQMAWAMAWAKGLRYYRRHGVMAFGADR